MNYFLFLFFFFVALGRFWCCASSLVSWRRKYHGLHFLALGCEHATERRKGFEIQAPPYILRARLPLEVCCGPSASSAVWRILRLGQAISPGDCSLRQASGAPSGGGDQSSSKSRSRNVGRRTRENERGGDFHTLRQSPEHGRKLLCVGTNSCFSPAQCRRKEPHRNESWTTKSHLRQISIDSHLII